MRFLRKLFFQIWYLRNPPWDTNQTPPELYDFMQANPPGRALDLGCGTGTNVIMLAQNGWQATGVDFVPKAISTAKKKARRAGVEAEFFVGDVIRLDHITGPFDLILDIGCYHSLEPAGMRSYQNQIKRLIAPGGTFMIYLFFKPEAKGSKLTGSNATEADLLPFEEFMELVHRQDGDERGIYRSSWLMFRKKDDDFNT